MEFEFPISTYLTIEKELKTVNAMLLKEKAAWQANRALLTENDIEYLDNQFTITFERLYEDVQNNSESKLQECDHELAALFNKGASASLMSTHELSAYNLAMMIKDIHLIHGKPQLDIVNNILRMTVIADAAIDRQKAYAGNGGITAIEQVCLYLAMGINEQYSQLTAEQYDFCYQIFPIICHRQPPGLAQHGEYKEPYHLFLQAIRASPDVTDLQEKTLLRIMALGWTPFSITDEWLDTHTIVKIAHINFRWLSMLLPYEHETLTLYLDTVCDRINPNTISFLLNAFTSHREIRKQVRKFFSHKPHWLMKIIISSTPEKIFDLIRRNEQDLLMPFLKFYKQDLINLRNKDNQGLLQYAMQCRSTVENTTQLLRQAGMNV